MRKLACTNPLGTHTTRFNGAATLSLRKLIWARGARRECTQLQWGRNFIVAETSGEHLRSNHPHPASMGPQLYRCGNGWGSTRFQRQCKRFNGAATLSLRKHSLQASGAIWAGAPQWGRNFIVAETPLRILHDVRYDHASMGPQLYRCGNLKKRGINSYMSNLLQWGRNFIVAETRGRSRSRWPSSSCFNGAATLSLRKLCTGARQPIKSRRRFNGAATLSLRKLGTGPRCTRGCRHASMGPQLYRCGNGTLGPIIGSDYD